MNNNLFNEMISGFVEAKKYRAGKKAKMLVSRVAFEPVSMKPAEIRRVRTRLRFSQPEFAEFLGTRVGTLSSREPGSRKPQSSALRLLAIAKEKPALLLPRRLTSELSSVAQRCRSFSIKERLEEACIRVFRA